MYHPVKKLMYTVRVDTPDPIGTIPPTPILADQFFNDSTGAGEDGGMDARGSDLLRLAFEKSRRNAGQVEPLKEVFALLEVTATPKPCKGMAGLLEEGNDVITEGEDRDDIAADLATIAAAQRVEHYEISGYGTSQSLAGQMRTRGSCHVVSRHVTCGALTRGARVASTPHASNSVTKVRPRRLRTRGRRRGPSFVDRLHR